MWWVARIVRRIDVRHRARRYRFRRDTDEVEWLMAALEPGDLALDIGAYKAGYTYWIRRAVGSGGRVIAFEPQPRSARYLRGTVKAFGWTNVKVVEAGLSSTDGDAALHAPVEGFTQDATLVAPHANPGALSYTVRVRTLDSVLDEEPERRPVRVIKCDVEGHELEVFRGARRTLVEDRPALLFECEARHDPSRPVEDVFRFLIDLGYEGFFFLGGRHVPVDAFRSEEHQVMGREPYVNNFVFIPEEAAGT